MPLTPTKIREALPLTDLRPDLRASDRMARCNLCGAPNVGDLYVWRECDELDRPTPGLDAVLLVCSSATCAATINNHPRLYIQDRLGAPGHFPVLCGDCEHRDGLTCRHPDLRTNGGPGLLVKLDRDHAIVCTRGRGGCQTPKPRAVACAGHQYKPRTPEA